MFFLGFWDEMAPIALSNQVDRANPRINMSRVDHFGLKMARMWGDVFHIPTQTVSSFANLRGELVFHVGRKFIRKTSRNYLVCKGSVWASRMVSSTWSASIPAMGRNSLTLGES